MSIEVQARARLHFGFLDPTGESGRRFGGIGLAISGPSCRLRIHPADDLRVEGESADRVEALAIRFHDVFGLAPRAWVEVLEAIPAHVGLGSGTQGALAVAAGLSRLHRLNLTPEQLSAGMGRGRRSGVGIHTFQGGGFVLEAGHPVQEGRSAPTIPPLVTRQIFPDEWRILLAVPASSRQVCGPDEESAFGRMTPVPQNSIDRLSEIVRSDLVPALAARDLHRFGSALSRAQKIVGGWFASAQGGAFHPAAVPLVEALRTAEAVGVGQSSWGPAVYALAGDEMEERRLSAVVSSAAPQVVLRWVRGWNRGASILSLGAAAPDHSPESRRTAPPQ